MYNIYPPPYGMPTQDDFERGMKIAMKLRDKEANKKAKAKELEEKKIVAAKQRMMTSLEWFIIGVLMQPVVGPLYHLMLHKLASMSP
jgi:hypothetical protein